MTERSPRMGIGVLPRVECNHALSTTCPVCTLNIVTSTWPSFDAEDIEECGLGLLWTAWERIR